MNAKIITEDYPVRHLRLVNESGSDIINRYPDSTQEKLQTLAERYGCGKPIPMEDLA